MRFYLLSAAFALASIVSALTASREVSGRDLALPQSNVAQFEGFPITAQSNSKRRRSPDLGPTNGELMKLGLQPASRPRKLYQARTLAKRQADQVPANAQASGATPGSQTYQFSACYDNVSTSAYSKRYLLTYTDIQVFADQCAAQQDLDNASNPSGTSRTFAIYNYVGDKGYCVTAVVTTGDQQVTCNSDSSGYYAPA